MIDELAGPVGLHLALSMSSCGASLSLRKVAFHEPCEFDCLVAQRETVGGLEQHSSTEGIKRLPLATFEKQLVENITQTTRADNIHVSYS